MSKIKWKTEYMIVCVNYPKPGHKSPVWVKKDLKAAVKDINGWVQDLDRLPEGHWRWSVWIKFSIEERGVVPVFVGGKVASG